VSIETQLNIPPAPVAEQPASSVRFSGRQLAKNSLYNYAGLTAPLLVGLISIPILLQYLGTERFGLLSLAWMVVGYFNVFDLGIGRATTKFVAEYAARNDNEGLCHVVWNAFFLAIVSSLFGAALVVLLTPMAVTSWLNIPPALTQEAKYTFYLLAAAVPIQLLSASARGVLEAQQKFGVVNVIRVPGSIASFAVPLLVLPFSTNLAIVVAAILAAKTIVLIAYVSFALRSIPRAAFLWPTRSYSVLLLGYGKWVTVSYVITPMLGQADRFLIGAVLSLSAVAYYCTPFDLITKLFIIPTGALCVLFPVFSAYSVGQQSRLANLQRDAMKYITIALLPMVFTIIALADYFLQLWLGSEFARESTIVLQILAIGVLINSIARVPLNVIEALGRPDLPARMYLIELPVYLLVLYLATSRLGIVGAAVVWTLRLLIESGILYSMAKRVSRESQALTAWLFVSRIILCCMTAACAYGLSMVEDVATRLVIVALITAGMIVYSFKALLNAQERSALFSLVSTHPKGAKS
jgi:O-antigen/teichoic acid export membrane protein